MCFGGNPEVVKEKYKKKKRERERERSLCKDFCQRKVETRKK
jgi:hypothetical protein